MSEFDISGHGVELQLIASKTFPSGIRITQFADDADAMDSASVEIAGAAMGLNGDKVSWGIAALIPFTINLIPGSDDEINMAILLEQNRVAQGKVSAKDEITIIQTFPTGQTTTLTCGNILSGMLLDSVASGSRKKTKVYAFSFGNKTSS